MINQFSISHTQSAMIKTKGFERSSQLKQVIDGNFLVGQAKQIS